MQHRLRKSFRPHFWKRSVPSFQEHISVPQELRQRPLDTWVFFNSSHPTMFLAMRWWKQCFETMYHINLISPFCNSDCFGSFYGKYLYQSLHHVKTYPIISYKEGYFPIGCVQRCCQLINNSINLLTWHGYFIADLDENINVVSKSHISSLSVFQDSC